MDLLGLDIVMQMTSLGDQRAPAGNGRRPNGQKRHTLMPADPSRGFDPYRAWLNVEEVHRPLTAYQLLRLKPLEEDVATIRATAGVQRMAIECHRGEASRELWEQVHDELEEAIDILLDADRKAAYDAALRQQADAERALQDAPAAVTGKGGSATVRCSRCGSASPATRRYCGDCGQSLWEPCPECGTLSMAGEKYCGACGADVLGATEQEAARAKAAIDEALDLSGNAEYDRAIAVLGPTSMLKHARLVEQAEQAGRLIRQLADQRDRAKAAALEAYEAARQLVDQHDYQAAIDRLEPVPAPLRTAEMELFLESQRGRLEEIAALESDIRSGMANGSSAGVPDRVRQLLTLKPDHALARRLAGRLRERYVRAARQKLSEHLYSAALRLLEQVPVQAATPELDALYQRAADLAYLLGDLRNAPYADEPLSRFAARLCELAPGDPRGAKLREEVKRRTATAAKNPRRGPARWARPPERTHVGWPVDWLTDVRRLGVKDEVARPFLADHPGRLFVACGLALQGLGRGPVQTNLLPADGHGIVGLVGHVLRKRPAHTAWGLDLSASGLKAVRLSAEGEQKPAAITDCDVIEHGKPLNLALNDEERRLLVAETLQTFCSRHDVKADRVCVGLSGRMVLVREIVVPLADRRKMARAVEYEARRQVPFPLSDLAWGYEVLDQPDARAAPGGEVHVAVVAVKRFPLKDHLARFASAGLAPDVVQSDCLALHNFLSYQRRDGQQADGRTDADDGLPTAVVDLGADTTSVLVSGPGMVWFRSTGFGGQSFNKALVRDLKLTTAQAEELKRDPSKAESPSRFHKAIEPVMEDLVAEVRASLAAFGRSRGRRQIRRILGVGGGFRMHGLLRYLRSGR